MVIKVGLHPGEHASYQHPMVFNFELIGHSAFLVGNGGHDFVTYIA